MTNQYPITFIGHVPAPVENVIRNHGKLGVRPEGVSRGPRGIPLVTTHLTRLFAKQNLSTTFDSHTTKANL